MKRISYIILMLFFGAATLPGTAQESRITKNNVGFIFGVGLATYNGDLTQRVQDWTPATNINLGIRYRLNRSISFRSDLNVFQLKGNNYEKGRNANFNTNNAELSVIALYDLVKLRKAYIHRETYTPYLFAGVGLLSYSGKHGNSENNNVGKHSGAFLPVIPVGVGLKIKASRFIDVAVEVGYRKTFSDNIDHIWEGGDNTTPTSVSSGLSNAQFVDTDSYLFTQVKLIYSPDKIMKKKFKSVNGLSKHEIRKIKHVSAKISGSKKLLNSVVAK